MVVLLKSRMNKLAQCSATLKIVPFRLDNLPKYPGLQEHTARFPSTRQLAYIPQGDGWQGWNGAGVVVILATASHESHCLKWDNTSNFWTFLQKLFTWDWVTKLCWISSISHRALTMWNVLSDKTSGILTASALTGIFASVLNTGLIRSAIRVHETFWSTIRRWSEISSQTSRWKTRYVRQGFKYKLGR